MKALKTNDTLQRKGCYALVFTVKRKNWIRVGKLGKACFPRGTYLYTGSAMNGLASRIGRHLRRAKKLHWHIDYLLRRADVSLREILLFPGTNRRECEKNQEILGLPGAQVLLRGFGAADCAAGCPSHLVRLARRGSLKLNGARRLRVTKDGVIRNFHTAGQKR